MYPPPKSERNFHHLPCKRTCKGKDLQIQSRQNPCCRQRTRERKQSVLQPGRQDRRRKRNAHRENRPVPKDLYITADLQKATVYEQEAVRLKYHVLALPGVGLSNTGLNEKPDFKNIVSLDIPTNPEFTLAHVNGVAYKNTRQRNTCYTLRKLGRYRFLN